MLVYSATNMSVGPYLDNGRYLALAQAMGLIFGMLSQLLLIRNLDLSNYGVLILLIDFSFTIAIIIDFGIPTWASRQWDGEGESVRNLIHKIMNIEGYNFLIVSAVTVIMIFIFDINNSFPTILIVFSTYIVIVTEPLRLGLRMIKIPKFEALSRIMERFFTFSIYLLLSELGNLNFLMVSVAIFFSTLVTFILTVMIFYFKVNSNSEKEYSFQYFETLKKSLPFTLALAVYPLLGRIDKIVLGIMKTVEVVGIYNIGWIIISVGFSISSILRQSINPLLAGKKNEIERLNLIKQIRYLPIGLIIIGIPSCIGISFYFMELLFPAEYLKSNSVFIFSGYYLVIAMIPSWIWSMLSASNLENTKFANDTWLFSKILAIMVIINALIDVILISKFTIFGIIIGTTVSQMVCYILLINNIQSKKYWTWTFRNEFVSALFMSIGLISYSLFKNMEGGQENFHIYSISTFLLGYFLMVKVLFQSFRNRNNEIYNLQ